MNFHRKSYDRNIKDKRKEMIRVVGGVVIIGAIVSMLALRYVPTNEHVITINDKERVTKSDGDGGITSEQRVYTNKGTFTLSDSFIAWNWETSDEYARLIPDQCYKVETRGTRIPFFSMFENIEKIKKINCKG